jgi:hypothetical protein
MSTRTGNFFYRAAIAVACGLCILFAGCGGEPDSAVRSKLTAIVEFDFKEILNDLPKKSISDSVFYRIEKYKTYQKGMYRAMAVVGYYYLKSVKVKRTVKYRYVKKAGQWERYGNEYQLYSDTTGT